ncbi:MAG: PorP/SprF family type IX secretion system membrane protein [Saprospiraceae bacterium]
MRIKQLLGTMMILFCMGTMEAQDIHFSQFYQSPLNLNPAMTGVMNCSQRLVGNYRNQWAAVLGSNAYNTYSVSYDRKMAVGQTDYFGVGGTLWADVAGASRFGTRQVKLSFSFSKKIAGSRNNSHYIVAGAEGGMTQRRVSEGDLRWPSQVQNGQFVEGIPGEVIQNNNFLYPDLSGGLLWFATIEKNSFYAGAAMFHLNQPNVSFLGREESLFSRLTVHAGGELFVNKKMSVLPNIIYLGQGSHMEINVGSSVRLALDGIKSNQYIQFGLWYRLGQQVESTAAGTFATSLHSDAIILATRFETGNYGVGFSYDYNISELATGSSANGSFELSVVYLFCGNESRGVYCPTF